MVTNNSVEDRLHIAQNVREHSGRILVADLRLISIKNLKKKQEPFKFFFNFYIFSLL